METSVNSDEVMQTNTITPYPNIQDIKKEMCDEVLASRLVKYDDFDFEPFQEKIFQSLSSHFDNNSNINEIDDACLKLENCFIENNILDKNGLTKSTLKGTSNSYIFLKYRDIDDAFVDMVISDSVGKFNKSNKCPKKIDLKHFKDNFFSVDFNDYEDNQSQCSDSDSEAIGESESFIEPSQSEIDITDSEFESILNEDANSLVPDNGRHVNLAKLSNTINSKSTDSNDPSDNLSPLKGTIRDVRIMVEKLSCNMPDREIPLKSHGTKIRQVARKKTGGMVINANLSESDDVESNKELNFSQSSKEDDLVPDGFDKMTRSDRRKLEKIIAESRANLVRQSDEIICEKTKDKNDKMENISNENESVATSTEKELDNTSNERETASTSNEKESDSTFNDKELDGSSNEDKLKENELLKSVVTNTILDFLIKSKGLKLGKEKVDLISDEITKKLNSFIPAEDGTDADEPTVSNSDISKDDNKIEENTAVKSNENSEESTSGKGTQENLRPNPPKKRAARKNASSANARKRLQEFEEIARDIINCKLSAPLVDELEEPLKPSTRQSLPKSDHDSVLEEPRRPITRQSLAKSDKDKILAGDEQEEPKKPTTRQSNAKMNTNVSIDDVHQETRKPITRQSLTKTDKDVLSNELPKEPKRLSNTTNSTTSISHAAKNDEDILIGDEHDEVKKRTTHQSITNTDTIIVGDDDVDEEPRRPATRRFLAINNKDIVTIDLDKEEPKKRKTVASNLPSLESEMEEPIRRTTRQSLQKQKEISKDSPESILITNELKSSTTAPKRRSNPKAKKNPAKKNVRKQRSNCKKESPILKDSNFIDGDNNDDSVICLSDSDTSKSSKILDSSFFSDRTILKASADSTTSETEPNEETADNRLLGNDIEHQRSPTTNNTESDGMKVTETVGSLSLDTEIAFSNSDVHSNSERNENVKDFSVDDGICLPDTSISVQPLNNLVNSNCNSETSDDNLKNVSKLVEDMLDESIKEKLSQNKESSEGSPFKNSFNALLSPSKDKKAPQPVDEPFQILNDMITDIEERLLKEETESSKNSIDNELNKDIDKISSPNKDCPSVTLEISADSTSFLNYTMDDSLKLMIDECTPQKENTLKDSESPGLKEGFKEKENSANNKESLIVSSNSEESNLKNKIDTKKEIGKSYFEVSGSEEGTNKEALESNKEVEKFESKVCSMKGDTKTILEPKKEVEKFQVKEKVAEEPEGNFSDKRINEKEKLSSATSSASSASLVSCKTLTNEEKIAQLTKRDPRLVCDKKISNVILRDPRLRNKFPKIEEKRENVLTVQNTSKLSELKLNISEKLESKIPEIKLPEPISVQHPPISVEHKQMESKYTEEPKKTSDHQISIVKPSEQRPSEQKLVVSKISETKVLRSLLEIKTVPPLKDVGSTSRESDMKLMVPSQKEGIKSDVLDYNSDQNRKKKVKKTVDEELLYKTPLSDLHDMHTERSTYERERDFKKKKLFPEGRRVRIITEERGRTLSIPRRISTIDEPNEERSDYNQPAVAMTSQGFFPRESQEENNYGRPNLEVAHRADDRYTEEVRYREKNLTYEEKTFYQEEREQFFPSVSSETFEQGSYVRRLVTETSYSETVHSRNDFPDNIYSRREFYRRNRYTHDHDHLGNSSRMLENANNIRQENEVYPQHNNFSVVEEPTFSMSAYPPVAFLSEPMYSNEEELDQSYGNMETESFSPPSSDLCPPPPLIRSPSPELVRRDNYCPSPPHIGRRNSTDEREYEEFSRAYHRKCDNDERGFRGRSNNSSRGQRGGNFRRGNGREYNNRRREESPPRKRFAGEHFRGRDDDRSGGRWRRSPSWSPERPRRWSRERSPLPPPQREQHPWKSPREPQSWESRESHPWNSPPRNRSPSPPRRRDNYRDRSSYYHRY